MRKKGTGRGPGATAQGGARLLPAEKAGHQGPGRSFLRSYLLRSLEVFMYWMPVWVPLILLAQLGTRGLQPALDERQRLLEHERNLLERLEADEARARELSAWHEAIGDEIYRERLRRLTQDELVRRLEARAGELEEAREPAAEGAGAEASSD